MSLVKVISVARQSRSRYERNEQGTTMKEITTKEVISLVGIAVTAPILALAILVSARRAAVADYDLLLVVLSVCGAVMSGLNGFGRRTIKTATFDKGRKSPQPSVDLHSDVLR